MVSREDKKVIQITFLFGAKNKKVIKITLWTWHTEKK